MPAENILKFSHELLEEQRKALFSKKPKEFFEPWLEVSHPFDTEMGSDLLKNGNVACVILAGGQGTRLEWTGPKALYPIVPEKNITLLQILLEKVRKASLAFGQAFEVAIMTSRLSHERFEQHAMEHNFYGLEKEQLVFFPQNVLPLLDEKGNWFYEKPGQLALGPDGNGSVFHNLAQTGILKRWKEKGIQAVIVLQVDNPLTEPFDPFILHELTKNKCDVVAKTIERNDPEEKIGVFAKANGKLCVVEYSEVDERSKTARALDGKLAWPYANIGVFAFSMGFVEKMADVHLPWHIAWKKAHSCDVGEIKCAKCETFIFDVLPLAKDPLLLLYSREKCYAPLKNKEGDKSPKTVLSKISHLV